MRPAVQGIHHLKFPVADLDVTEAFYRHVFGARRLHEFDHVSPNGELFAVILDVPGLGTHLELRIDARNAAAMKGLDFITFNIGTQADAVEWEAWLAQSGIPHSKVLVGLFGWLLVLEDPDGRRLRMYTRQTHGRELEPDWSDPWLQPMALGQATV